MGDRGRGQRGRQQYDSRPLGSGRMLDYSGRGALGRTVLGAGGPQRSGGLTSLGLSGGPGPLASSGTSAGGAAGAGGRGAGPDHREVRYAEGVLAMINILRVLTLGGSRMTDATAIKQAGMTLASRPAAGVAGRDISLLVNHFSLGLRINSTLNVYSVNFTDLNPAALEPSATNSQQQQQQAANGIADHQQQRLPRGLSQRVLQELSCQAGWPAGWVLVGHDRLASSGMLTDAEAGSSGSKSFTVKLLPQSEEGAASTAAGTAAAAPGGAVLLADAAGATGGIFKVDLQYLGLHDLSDLRNRAAAAAAGEAAGSSSGPLLDGIHLLEALLLAAALQPPPPLTNSSGSSGGAAPLGIVANGPLGGGAGLEASTPIAVPGSTAVAGTGLLGLAGIAAPNSSSSGLLGGGAASNPLLAGLASSPAATGGLLAAGLSQPGMAGMGGGLSAGGALPGAAGIGSNAAAAAAAAAATAAAAGCPGVRRVLLGDVVYFYAPGNVELHAPLGGGLEGWLGFKEVVTQTQLGLALVIDLTASPFYEPGPLTQCLAALMGLAAVTHTDEAAAAAAEGGAGGSSDGSNGLAAAALSALPGAEWKRAEQLLKGLKVEVTLPGQQSRLWRVKQLSDSNAADTTFTLNSSSSSSRRQQQQQQGEVLPDGSSVSVAAYFKAVYGLELSAPQLPCVDVGRKGGPAIWYPLELCSLPAGERYTSPLTYQQLAALNRLASKKATDRRAWLEGIAGPLATAAHTSSSGSNGSNGSSTAAPLPNTLGGLSLDPTAAQQQQQRGGSSSGPVLPSGLEVSGVLGVVRGRVLPPPHLAYQTPECAYPGSQGQWNVKSCRLPGCSRINSWVLVVLLPQAAVDIEGPAGVIPFLQDLTSSLKSSGIECEVPPIVYEQPGLSVLQHLKTGCDVAQRHFNASPDLLLVMLPSRSPSLYQEVKVATDAALGVPSQVLVAPVAGVGQGAQPRGRLQYCSNLGLKINAKLGGVNVRLAGNPDQVIPVIGARPFVLFGVAVAPPPRGAAPNSPSLAAVVASRDRSLGRYSSRVLLQANQVAAPGCCGGGIVTGLRGAAKELLIDFYRQNGGRKPEALLLYRTAVRGEGGSSGSSGGRLSKELLQAEYDALRGACSDLEEGYCPPITFVGVNRHHNTRLFPADRDNQDKSGNCVPGTVVDTGICHPTQFDFFLNSHAGLQGHNKPAHYQVLVDENSFSADGLQLLTYWLCYLYCRCSRSVSMVPPAYYAQLAAERGQILSQGRDLLEGEDGSSNDTAAAAAAAAGGSSSGDAAAAEGAAAAAVDAAGFDVRVNVRLGGSMYYV